MIIMIEVLVEDGDPNADPDHPMGITSDAFDRLSGHTEEHGAGSLEWLGEVQDVVKKQ